MSRRYLFGPVTGSFVAQCLAGPRRAGECLTFGHAGAVDLHVGPADSWETVLARLPAGWRPDFVALDLHYTSVPACFWTAPVPLVGLAADANLLWHYYRQRLAACELVLTDTATVEALARAGIAHARAANLFGCERAFLEMTPEEAGRDIDVLFVGNVHPAVQRERLPWLARVTRLAERRRVVVRTNVYGDDYRGLLARARVVFNRAVRGEANLRAFEAAAAGALLFQEAENRELPALFTPGKEYVPYTDADLEARLAHYLDHEDERRTIAAAGRERARRYGFEDFWQGHLELIEREWAEVAERAQHRPRLDVREDLLARTWQLLGSNVRDDVALVADIQALLAARPEDAALHNALGVTVAALRPRGERASPPVAREAAEHFRRAWEAEPTFAMAGLNLAEALAIGGAAGDAAGQARRVLELLDRQTPADTAAWDAGHYPPRFDHFRVEWERAGWEHAGRLEAERAAKDKLLRWRLYSLLAEYEEAVRARPDLPPTQAALGIALGRQGRHADAVHPLRLALAGDPFHAQAAHALFDALGGIGDEEGRGELVHDRRLLARGAPGIVPVEAWFAEAPAHLLRDTGLSARAASAAQERRAPRATAIESSMLQGPLGGADVAGAEVLRSPGLAPPACGTAPGLRSTSAPATIPLIAGLHRTKPLGIVWEGLQGVMSSLAVVNREFCRKLIERSHEVSVLPRVFRPELGVAALPCPRPLLECFGRPLARPVDVHVRHSWPPDFTPPPAGYWVMMQPWEFGSLPRAWVEGMTAVDEVWAYSRYVRDCYVNSGVPADRVHVVPLGIDPARFHPWVPPLPLRTRRRFKFLFVGGTIHRKGIDVLLDAYAGAFTATDDVCLVIKDLGAGTYYKGQTAGELIARHQARAGGPEIEYLAGPLTEEQLAGLYTACDCLVHPYRGEGFGLPIAEAMACGLPVIVTGAGAPLDFCNAGNAYLIPAKRGRFRVKRIGGLETVDYPWLAEPDREALRSLLRQVVKHPEEARSRGRAGCEHIHRHFTWDRAVEIMEQRLYALCRETVGSGQWAVDSERTGRVSEQRNGVPTSQLLSTAHSPLSTFSPPLPTISLCMIVKNEKATLEKCLRSAADLVNEMVVVDTGSTDRTREIALALGARVIDFAWCDDFAAARNAGVDQATGQWIFWLDADEWLDEVDRERLRRLFARLPAGGTAYLMRQLSLSGGPGGATPAVDQVRLFPNHPALRWEYRVHEQVMLAVRRLGLEVCRTDVLIAHGGYQDAELSQKKLQRNLRLLELSHRERPDEPIIQYHLGWIYLQMGRAAQALPLLTRSLEQLGPEISIAPKLHALLARAQAQLGQPGEALEGCRRGLERYPGDTELLFVQAVVRREQGDLAGAEACVQQLLRTSAGSALPGVDLALRGHKARQLLAEIYQAQQRWAEAESQWRQLLAEQPGLEAAQVGLAEAGRAGQ